MSGPVLDGHDLSIAMIGPFGLRPKGTMRVRALPLARELVARGHRVSLLMPPWHTPDVPPRMWEDAGVQLVYVPLKPNVPLLSYALVTRRLVRAALALDPDVIHCFKPKAYAGLAAWWLWQRRHIVGNMPRLVIDEDDWEGPGGWNDLAGYGVGLRRFFAWQERWGLTHNDAVTVASRTLHSLVWSLGVPSERVHYMPNAIVPRGLGDASSMRRSLSLGDAPAILLYTRFFEFDPAFAAEVLSRVREAVPQARLVVVGQGLFPADDERFQAAVAAAGLANAVVNAGWVPMKQLSDYFAVADVAIYPFDDNLVNRTKCPVKLLDLVGAGIPVVGADVGQIREAVRPNQTGLLVPSGDASAMAQAVVKLLQAPELRRQMRAQAVVLAQALGWPQQASALERLYRELLAAKR